MTDDIKKIEVTEVKAFARDVHIAARKARLVTSFLKNMAVDEALTQLKFLTKRATGPVSKLLRSAIANARHNHEIERERLYVKSLTVDEGRASRRYKPRAQGRAFPVRKKTSHINLILGVADKPLIHAEKAGKTKALKAHDVPTEKSEEKQEKKKGWFGGKSGDEEKLAKREDTKGKSGKPVINRKGNM